MNNETRTIEVTAIQPESSNLLGLMMTSLIRRQIIDPVARRHALALRGRIAVNAGGMLAVIDFSPERITIQSGTVSSSVKARIRGTLVALLDAALGRRRLEHVFRGDLIAWGSPWALWHLLGLLRVANADASRSSQNTRH